jgi:sulfur carrier protein ThiS
MRPSRPKSDEHVRIQVCLYASLSSHLPGVTAGDGALVDAEPCATVGDVLKMLGIEPDSPKILFVNGIHAKPDRILKEGDRLAAFPPIAGG